MSQARIFVFGLDGASWKLIDPWIKEGRLPFLGQLSRQGIKKDLISTMPPRTAPAWASFISGQTPDEHGVYDFFVKDNPFVDGDGRLVNGSWLTNKFWKKWKQKRVALINLPLGHPVERVRGVLVSSFLTPPQAQFVYPAKMASVLIQLGYQSGQLGFLDEHLGQETNRQLLAQVKVQMQARFRLAEYLLKNDDFDFFFMLLRATDLCQHLFWKDKRTLKIYQEIDSFLADFYRKASKKYGARNIQLMIISDHGFHPTPTWQFNIYPWLRQNGFLPRSVKAQAGALLRKVWFWEKDKTKSRFKDWGLEKTVRIGSFGLWTKNLSTRKELVEKLSNLEFMGKKVFQLLDLRENVYPKSKKGSIWDLVWLTNPEFSIGPCSIERKLFVKNGPGLKGTHDSDRRGIFLFKGVGGKRILRDWENKDLHIWELSQLFNKIFGLDKTKTKARPRLPTKSKALSKEEEELIKKRLRQLGYLR
ncbi:MAG: alkaline phosphatase family protein [Patescibacteria group bacterium]